MATATHLDLGMQCIKYLLCAVNFLFVLTGVMIVSVGTTIYAVYDDFSHFLDSSYFSPASLLIGVGVFVFVIAFCGCCGALKESTCMVLTFAVSLSVVLLLEFSASVASYALQDNIIGLLDEKINGTMKEYAESPEAKSAIDFLQSRLHCCGYNGPSDWLSIAATNGTGNPSNAPDSCCDRFAEAAIGSSTGKVEGPQGCTRVFPGGCYAGLALVVNRSALYLITGASMIALIQISGILFACMLGRAIRKQKTEREMRRWQMRESLLSGYEPLGKTDPFTAFPIVYVNNQAGSPLAHGPR